MNCLITYFILVTYFITYLIAINSGSLLLALIIVFFLVSALIVLSIVFYQQLGILAYCNFYGLVFAALGLFLINIPFVATNAEIDYLPLILIAFCSCSYVLGFLLAYCIFEAETTNDVLLKRKWQARHIITSFLGSYLFIRGFFLIASIEYYPSDFNMTDVKTDRVKVKSKGIYIGVIVAIFLISAFAYCIQRCVTARLRQSFNGKECAYPDEEDEYIRLFTKPKYGKEFHDEFNKE